MGMFSAIFNAFFLPGFAEWFTCVWTFSVFFERLDKPK